MATDDRSTESTVLGGSGGDMGRSIEAAVARAIAGNGPVGESDVAALGAALFHCGLGLARNPYGAFEATSRYGTGLLRAGFGAAARLMGLPSDGPVPEKQDKRFDDPAWSDNVAFWWLRQVFALTEQLASDLVAESDLEERTWLKAAFATQLMLDAMSPTNLAITNPTVLKRAFDSGGVSLATGFRNFLDDFASNQGRRRQVQPGVDEVGRNLAVTHGKVVFRNGLMELIKSGPR